MGSLGDLILKPAGGQYETVRWHSSLRKLHRYFQRKYCIIILLLMLFLLHGKRE